MDRPPVVPGLTPDELLLLAREYVAVVVAQAEACHEVTAYELVWLRALGYLGPDRLWSPRRVSRHAELEAEMHYLLARRIAARLRRTGSPDPPGGGTP
jgi:hypothetical protein